MVISAHAHLFSGILDIMQQEYEQWMAEKMPRRTSDECHTPPDVYECVAEWVSKEYDVPRAYMCRPFYPDGDYRSFDYSGKIVVDNPPFSILSEIIGFYQDSAIKFFLFAPALTSFSSKKYYDVCHIFAVSGITYDNGVEVATCFLTNLEPDTLARLDQDLRQRLLECKSQKKHRRQKSNLGNGEFHGAKLNTLSGRGEYFHFLRDNCEPAKKTRLGKNIYGGGFRLKEGH